MLRLPMISLTHFGCAPKSDIYIHPVTALAQWWRTMATQR